MANGERVRIEVGFEGGQVIGGFVDGSSADQLERALHEDGPRVVVLETEDGPYHIVVALVRGRGRPVHPRAEEDRLRQALRQGSDRRLRRRGVTLVKARAVRGTVDLWPRLP